MRAMTGLHDILFGVDVDEGVLPEEHYYVCVNSTA